MPSYLTFAEYKARSRLRDSTIDRAGSAKVEVWLREYSSDINSRLTKRYAVDFADPGPKPEILLGWLTAFVDRDVQEFCGGPPEGREDEWIVKRADRAEEKLKEAADSEQGLRELPLRDTDPLGSSAINKGAPMVVSYHTVYDAFDAIAAARTR